jgi:hypothetical protein
MRRIMVLLPVLALSMISSAAYGAALHNYVLIYKASISGKVLDFDASSLGARHLSAYLVLDIDDGLEPADYAVIDYAAIVIYDVHDKSYLVIDTTGGAIAVNMGLSPGPGGEKIAAIDISDPVKANLWCIMTGKIKMKDVGLPGGKMKKIVPASLKGNLVINNTFFDQTDIMGSGVIKATLNSGLTKAANAVQADVGTAVYGNKEQNGFDGVVTKLQAKHYNSLK